MNFPKPVPAYRPVGVALLRTTVHEREHDSAPWPAHDQNLANAAEVWRPWLVSVWSQPHVSSAVRVASPGLAGRLDALSAGDHITPRQVRRMTFALARYMVRMRYRATPFGLFAGVAAVRFGSPTAVDWNGEHRPTFGVDARWLANVIARLEACPQLRKWLRVTANDLAEVRGQRLLFGGQPHATEPGRRIAGEFSIRHIPAVRTAMELAAEPIPVGELREKLGCEYPAIPAAEFDGLLAELIAQGVLVSELRPPSTCTDGLDHLLEHLAAMPADALLPLRFLVGQLRETHRRLAASTSSPHGFDDADYRAVTAYMTSISDAAEQPATVDLRLGATATLPPAAVTEAAAAAGALVRLSPVPAGVKAWREYHRAFLETYGPGALVPVEQLTNAAAGLGFPRHFHEQPQPPSVSARDEQLLALAHQAALDGAHEIVLDAAALDSLVPPHKNTETFPHVDVWFDLRAATAAAVDAGDFTVAVCGIGRPGAAVGRFLHVLPEDDRDLLAEGYRSLPAMVGEALPVQLSFPPRMLAAENVLRAPQIWPDVISLGEHHSESPNRLSVSDLGVTADQHRMYLVSLSRRRVLEPHIPHAAARHAMPLLARFLFEAPRATGPAVSSFDWGIAAKLPFLPRVRFGKAILAPAQWRLNPTDLPSGEVPQPEWDTAFTAFRERRRMPAAMSVGSGDRQLRLRLDDPMDLAVLRKHVTASTTAVTLLEAATAADHGWLESRAHEIVLPLVATQEPAKSPAFLVSSAPVPLVRNGHAELSGAAGSVVNATIYAPPDAVDEILLGHLPGLWSSWEEPPLWWFIRYRSPEPQLRLRIRHSGYGHAAERVGAWVQGLREARLVNRVSFDTYYPENGRYGSGAAMAAAEELFAADSNAVLAQLTVSTGSCDVHPYALTAASMADLACAITGDRAAGMRWLIEHPHLERHTPIHDRDMLRQAQHFAEESALHELPQGAQLVEAWQARADAAHTYATSLTSSTTHLRSETVLSSLLHMHYVRAHGIDPAAEAITHRLAHSIASSWNARGAQNSGAKP